jgi:hypothetical protein
VLKPNVVALAITAVAVACSRSEGHRFVSWHTMGARVGRQQRSERCSQGTDAGDAICEGMPDLEIWRMRRGVTSSESDAEEPDAEPHASRLPAASRLTLALAPETLSEKERELGFARTDVASALTVLTLRVDVS